MDLEEIEFAAKIVRAICREHPEICPHSYHFSWSRECKESGTLESHYKCILCGHEYVETTLLN